MKPLPSLCGKLAKYFQRRKLSFRESKLFAQEHRVCILILEPELLENASFL